MTDLEIIILAAGKGTRMSGEKPKVLTDIKGKPMISYILKEIEQVHDKKPILVLGYRALEVKKELGEAGRYTIQEQQLGTGHAVATALPSLLPEAKSVMVLYGDHPLIDAETVENLYKAHASQNTSPVTLGTVVVNDFLEWRQPFYDFGRIIRDADNKILKIVERKDSNPEELAVCEVNPSYFCFNKDWLIENIKKINCDNAQGEFYLTDLIGLAQKQGFDLNSYILPTQKALGVNTPEQLALVLQFI